ncbi:MAG: UDP-N-acetyl-D-glucosamine dehydrogenase, partial [Gammaproteobacteria bacterium]
YVPVFPKMRRYSFPLASIELTAESIAAFDCVVIGTSHDAFDYDLILANSALVIDTRGVYRDNHENVIRA